jgi:hypothetical protein
VHRHANACCYLVLGYCYRWEWEIYGHG